MSDGVGPIVRRLRTALLDEQRAVAPASMRNCAAHMLLYFGVEEIVHRIALQFLLEVFEATRANLGYGTPATSFYTPSAIETAPGLSIPSISRPIPNQIEPIQRVWQSADPVCLNARNVAGIEKMWAAAQTKSKLACRLESDHHVFGMVCVDDTVRERQWRPSELAYLTQFVQQFLAPILASYQQMRSRTPAALTSAELAAVQLAARGFSYSEIAAALAKSRNTIDNQLRTARAKLGAHNQVELIQACTRWLSD